MNISKTQLDPLNAEINITLDQADFQPKVDSILLDYKKKANIPGFRKGQVPMGMIKKQYGKSVLVEEINKLLQGHLNTYLTEEKLSVLGNPLPKVLTESFDWNAASLSFAFEIGLSPEFEVSLKTKKAVTSYKLEADKKMVNDQILSIRNQYGKITPTKQVTATSEITGLFKDDAVGIDKKTTITLDQLKSKKAKNAIEDAAVGTTVQLETKGLFKEDTTAASAFGLEATTASDLKGEVSFTIQEINERTPAALDKDLFDKLFGEGVVKTEKELAQKIKEDAEKQFEQQADQKLLNDVTEALIAHNSFDLPAAFLTKWIQSSGEKPLTAEEAKIEYEKSEQGLRYQLIEAKIIEDNKLQVSFEDLKSFAKELIKTQMAQYGQLDPKEEELDGIAARVLSNQEEVKRLSEQMMSQKLITLYKEKANLKEKSLSYDAFVKEVYGA
ncbi:MAG: trigger factor [Flavobacteriaceae bacterium]|jgi:trigger factor|tara:strand:+ start:425 stop:1753 length:1329 start_codon:yes stop_codon:yes gene_type:complete